MPNRFKSASSLMVCLCSALLCLLILPSVVFGQIANVTNDTSTPIPGVGHDYIKLFNETVNPSNGSVSLRIGIPSPPGRMSSLPFAFAYDSNGAHMGQSIVPGWGSLATNKSFLSSGGWTYAVPMLSDLAGSVTTVRNNVPFTCYYYSGYVFNDPTGGRHALGLAVAQTGTVDCTRVTPTPYSRLSGGDDFYQASTSAFCSGCWGAANPVSVRDADGTVYQFNNPGIDSPSSGGPVSAAFPTYIEDRNGNKITVSDSHNGAFSFTDTLGRTLISSSGFGLTGNTVTVAGLPAYTLTWGTANTNFSVSYVQEGSDSSCYGMKGDNETLPVITAITLPGGQEYQFQYESTYGQVDKIIYPSGGYVRYVWGLNSRSAFGLFGDNGTVPNPQGCEYQYDFPAVTDRYVSFDGSTEIQHQHFSYSTNWASGGATWTTKLTTVTTNDLLRNESFQTVYTYTSVPAPAPPNVYDYFAAQLPVESTVSYDDWGGSNIRTTTKNWVDQFEMQGEQVQNNGTVVSDQFSVFGYQGQITNKYECGSGQTCYNATQASPPSAYARHTNITYYSSIPDRPLSVITSDGSGDKAAETDYSYDCCTLTATSGVVNHDYTNYSASQYANRGNATSVSKWVNTSGGSLTWNYAYDDTGQALSMKDPKTNQTTYSYADSFAGCGSAGGSTNAYLTKITDAKGFTQNFTYRYCDGQLNSATDRNSKTTSYAYADSLNRLTQITYPDTGQTGYSYTGICGHPSATTILIQSGSSYTESATLDGICHVTQTAVTSDPTGSDFTDTTYDGEGRVWTVSNPYRSKSENTYGLTTTSYDALGRTTSVTYPDTNSATTSYSGLSFNRHRSGGSNADAHE